MNTKTKNLTVSAMLCAISYAVMLVGRIPMVLFLKYDPKDIIITMGGFMLSPWVAAVISVVVSLVEMVTVSDTGLYGLLMNIVSTCSFACIASLIYHKKRTLTGAIFGLVLGCLAMSGVMLLWNYYITPLYMGVPQSVVAGMLIPVFLPFNLIKGALNAAGTILFYKPIITGLRKASLLPTSNIQTDKKRNILSIGTAVASLFVIICLVMVCMIIW